MRAGVPRLDGLRGVGGGVHSGVRSGEDDDIEERHTENVNVNHTFGETKQWTPTLWGFVRAAFGDG